MNKFFYLFIAFLFITRANAQSVGIGTPSPNSKVGKRFGTALAHVPMVCDTLRDLQAAQAAGCEPHLVRSGRAAALDDATLATVLAQVPSATVHADLPAFVSFLLAREAAAAPPAGQHGSGYPR